MAKKDKEKTQEKTETKSSLEQSLAVFEELDTNFASSFKLKAAEINVVDTGSPAINSAIGINGYPKGRITHIYGPNGAGKSFLAMIAIQNALKDDPTAVAVWFDAENSFSTDWGLKLGIWDPDPKKSRVKVIKGNKGKDIFERLIGKIAKDNMGNPKKTKDGLIDYIKNGKLNCPIMVIDSIADIISPREEVAVVGAANFASLSMFLTQELKRLSSLLEETDIAFICINQVRQNIDEISQRRDGKYHFPGGENLAHKMSVNILCDKVYNKDAGVYSDGSGADENSLIGRRTKITIKKSRFGPAPRTCYTTLIFTEGGEYNKIGIGNVEQEIMDLGLKFGYIKQGGAWFNLNFGNRTDSFQGGKKVVEFLKANPNLYNELCALIKSNKPTIVEGKFAEDDSNNDLDDLLENPDDMEE